MIRRFLRNYEAAAVLEMAVVLPVLVLIAIGVAEFGRIYFAAIRVANAATAGAEFGSQNSGTADSTYIRQVAQNDAGDPTLLVSTSRVCRCPDSETEVSCSSTCTGYGNPQFYVQVTASTTFSFLLRYPGLPASLPVTKTATFRVQ
jgi:Flp pilus assembly protein TadG